MLAWLPRSPTSEPGLAGAKAGIACALPPGSSVRRTPLLSTTRYVLPLRNAADVMPEGAANVFQRRPPSVDSRPVPSDRKAATWNGPMAVTAVNVPLGPCWNDAPLLREVKSRPLAMP
jgi:hypothetical protein